MRPAAVITGTGLAVPGLRDAADLLGGLLGDGAGGGADGGPSGGGFQVAELERRGWKYRDRASRLASCAAEPALREAGLLGEDGYRGPGDRSAVVVSSNFGVLENVCGAMDVLAEHGSAALSPMGLPHTGANMTAGWLAIDHGLSGPNLTVCNGATGGIDALYWARNLVAADRADIVLVVGVEPDGRSVARLHGDDGTTPGAAGRRLDGAAAVVVESTASAAARGAAPRAVPSGFGRAKDLPAAVRATVRGPVGTVLAAADADRPAVLEGVPVLDLTARLGGCSGALGVLQCLAAVALFDRGETRTLLATCGGAERDDAAAALALTPAEV
ncbi:beta-ketoacyl synthase N-terminal-like domain-containing protein [Actinomadura fibrosa]|uniref:Beta-ketoacyl synthase N-terminal-like domain-containing protein n=1 Tax=Actinomadura fibrosa TaxID=111802 RepID=A0ABW2XVR8_9ACTN